ncbi:putative transmembrane protein TauE [Helianthus annuus]|uniref:Transmembrane protein TauE n=1 Tax=Helianthus annuus TaxID=4232 RepID=A0A251TF48_HELAN|nr:sulfite exporter TauE/SafE family protein 4 [Helianthus annuus]KAF5784116.1 putative transmembrane protein TauE [Helianthus annuus]KAJ0511646.1 putative transmembrane protein TauE [Helianthus annuus]KAJ0519309.1 putative transmembrane protein TauE [Helianthus annuus]KAJ0691105.1 putative transmembrane protein TauE [Helianthus annuus]
MTTKSFVLYLVACSSAAVLTAVLIAGHDSHKNNHLINHHSPNSGILNSDDQIWPELAFNWRIMLATLIGFLGSAFGTVGGVGGGGIFVPMLTLVVGFDTKSAAALSKCMIMGASASSFWYNLRVQHPCREVPILDYDLALLFQPMLMLGITLGVALSVVFPYWLITVLIIILFLGTSSRSFFRGIEMWKEESILKKEMAKSQETFANSRGELLIDTLDPLIPKEKKTQKEVFMFNLRWKKLMLLVAVWAAFLVLQVIKNDLVACSTWYWVFTVAQFPATLAVFGFECVKLYKESKKRKSLGNTESVCEATINWTVPNLIFCALCGILGGTVGGLLGSGGGFILGPLLLEIGVIPQVASATATFVMMFSSSLSVVEFYLLKRFPIPYALYLMSVSVLAGFWGQFFVRKLVVFLKRASIIVFILSAVIFASALTMGVIGIEQSIRMIHNHEFMGFLDFCSNQ